ncbi:MAG: nicotinate phosphoribosyltransferase, partial [Actinomycetota bacterium]
EVLSPGDGLDLYHPHRQGVMRHLETVGDAEELVLPAYKEGERIGEQPSLDEMRQRRIDDLHRLDPGVRRLVNPHVYHVSLSEKVKGLQRGLIEQARSEG